MSTNQLRRRVGRLEERLALKRKEVNAAQRGHLVFIPTQQVGRPRFEPTEQQRRQVAVLLRFGLLQTQIIQVIFDPNTDAPISERTFRVKFAREIGLAKKS